MNDLDARRAHDIGDICDQLFDRLASAMSAFGQDPQGLEAKPASATAKPGRPTHPSQQKETGGQ